MPYQEMSSRQNLLRQRGVAFSECNHLFEETENVLIRLQLSPIEPTDFVVLVIGIVVAKLGVQELITSPEHRDAVRQQNQTAEVLNLFPPQRQNRFWRLRVSFVVAVPAVILVHPILVVLTIGPVMFLVVRNEVVKCEAVVRVDIVHSLICMIGIGPAVRKQIVAA